MNALTRTIALTTAGAIVAVPTAVLVAAPAQADVERQGACGSGTYELSVDREGNGFEIDAGLENQPVGSRWTIVLKHDGKRFAKVVRTTDGEGDLDVDRFRKNTSGKDVFTMKATRVGGGATCSTKVTTR